MPASRAKTAEPVSRTEPDRAEPWVFWLGNFWENHPGIPKWWSIKIVFYFFAFFRKETHNSLKEYYIATKWNKIRKFQEICDYIRKKFDKIVVKIVFSLWEDKKIVKSAKIRSFGCSWKKPPRRFSATNYKYFRNLKLPSQMPSRAVIFRLVDIPTHKSVMGRGGGMRPLNVVDFTLFFSSKTKLT